MASIQLTIEKIEGNSNIGVPVFSKVALKNNYNYNALTPANNPKLRKPHIVES